MPVFAPPLSLPSLAITPKMIAMVPFKHPRANVRGDGYLAGEFPAGITTVEGVPTPAEIRVLLRTAENSLVDGDLVASTVSAPDGTWRVDGLSTALKFDVVGRKPGFNDVIVAGVTPAA